MKHRLAASLAALSLASTASARDPQRVDYTIDVNLDTGSHELTGHERIELTNRSNKALEELWWHLYLNAFANDQTTFFRGSTGGRGSEKREHWGYTDLKSVRIAIGDEAPVVRNGSQDTGDVATDDAGLRQQPPNSRIVAPIDVGA